MEERNIGYVPQNYGLFPNMSVRANIEFGIKVRGVPRQERERRVRELVRLLGLEGLLDRRSQELSAGQQQRVALARALAIRPKLLLLDEPLSNLDPKSVRQSISYLRGLVDELSIGSLVVSHEISSLLEVADAVFFMESGKLYSLGSAEEALRNPRYLSAARYLGFETFLKVLRIDGNEAIVEGLGSVDLSLLGNRPARLDSSLALYLALRPMGVVVEDAGVGLDAVRCHLSVEGTAQGSYMWIEGMWRVRVRLPDGAEVLAVASRRVKAREAVTLCIDTNKVALVAGERF